MIEKIFQPHLRLIYIFVWGFIVSAISYIPFLLVINIAIYLLLLTFLVIKQEILKTYITRWLKFHIFTFVMWLTMSWKIGDNGIELNPQGIHLVLVITLRLNLLLGSIWVLLMNMNDCILLQAIQSLPLPKKLTHLFVLSIRYIGLLGKLNTQIEIAMKARGYSPKFNTRTIYIISQRVALLLIHTLIKTEQAEIALKARGFDLSKKSEKIR
ncbi:energy-coupling factor transporter transmembrane component T [Otariodibacter sp.]|uniref:energy-coupling factor transporter transmembrane component T family protein n=1 Tax=Otariodibacter sp. TaxID=3030919 RepID=UPI0026381FC9|nr:energy-coupling factor transporter transmembrane component T [Otariodibacter sp.]